MSPVCLAQPQNYQKAMLCSPLNIELSGALMEQTEDDPYNSNSDQTTQRPFTIVILILNELKCNRSLPANPRAADFSGAILRRHRNSATKVS